MRKYYQAALAVTAVVSLACLLFYRHEYNKLRYVLEVFNYFGKPNQKTIETNCTNNVPVFTKFNMKFEEPLSSWQKLDDELYIYSAYNIRRKEVQVIGFGSLNSIKDIQCMIFFENEIEPTLGSFKYILINDNSNITSADKSSNYNGYHFYCTYVRDKTPVGITFLTNSNTNLDDTPILAVKSPLHNFNYANVAICVTPPLTKPMHPSEMIAFINFHDIIGMDNFIVYDFGIPTEFNGNLKELSRSQNPYWKFTYTTVPWNFPFFRIHTDMIKNLIQADCLYRTYNKAKYVTTLSWEEYIVLKYHHSFVDLMIDFQRPRLKTPRYKLRTLTFCMQQTDARLKNSTFVIFRKTHFDPNIIDHRPVYIYNGHDALNKDNIYTREIGRDLVMLNRYKYCSEEPNPNVLIQDSSVSRFAEDILNSPIYRKFMAENKSLWNK